MADNRGNLRGSGILGGARTVKGTSDFLKLSKALKEAGNKTLRKELHKAVTGSAKPLIPKVRQAARDKLPSKGGMNEHYARKAYRTQARTGQKSAGVRIVGPKTDPRVDQQGRVTHPVFGRPNSTVVQNVPAAKGFFSDTLAESGPQIRDDFLRALGEFTDRIVRDAR